MSPDQHLATLSENVRYIRERVDDVHQQVSDLRVHVEKNDGTVKERLRAVEIRSGFWGAVSGVLTTIGFRLFYGSH